MESSILIQTLIGVIVVLAGVIAYKDRQIGLVVKEWREAFEKKDKELAGERERTTKSWERYSELVEKNTRFMQLVSSLLSHKTPKGGE